MLLMKKIIRKQKGWPYVFELNIDESITLDWLKGHPIIKLISVEEFFQPDYWIIKNVNHLTYYKARITLEISGVKTTLFLQPTWLNAIWLMAAFSE